MKLEIIILSEVSQKEKDHMISLMWNLKYDTNEPIYKTETQSQTGGWVAKGGRGWGRDGVGGWGEQM